MKKRVKEMLKRWMAIGMLVCMTVGILQVPGSQVEAEENTTPSLKAAILSDVHLGYNYGDLANGWEQKDWFKYILQWYKNADVDAVIIPGDLVDAADNKTATAETQFQEFFDVWNSVFTAEDNVEPIFIYGNHDKWLSQNEASGDYWNKYLGETFSPVYSKQVGDYWFVCVHDGFESANKDELKKQLDAAVAASNGAPVFYLQHSAIYQTTGASDGSVSGDVTTGFDVIKDYENVVALTGHTHRSIVNDASIWQGDDWNEGQFTTITCSTLAYGSFEDNDYTGNNLDPKVDSVKTKQGLIMNASGNEINVERYSFYTDEMVGLVEGTDPTQDYDKCVKSAGDDWNFTVGGEKPYTFDKCYENSVVPEFPEYAKNNDDLLETCERGYSFGADGDIVYSQSHGICEKDGRNVLKVTRAANVTTEYPYTYPIIHITLPKDVSLTEDTYISLDAWFNEYAHPWTTIILYNDAWGPVGSKSNDYGKEAWETFCVQVKDMDNVGDLSTVTKIGIQINVTKNIEYDTEFYFDNLKLITTNAECSDTSATVTFPSASMIDDSMFKDYVVEARDVNSGVIKATATVNTEYRIDTDIASRYKDAYSLTVNGLLEDTTYDFYIYGRNFYGKCSTEPLVITAKTTAEANGKRTDSGDEKGDVNGDFYTDVRDLVALKANGASAVNKDVDENGTVDAEADKNGLIRILLGYTSVVQDSEKDLIGQSTYQSGTLLAGKKGYGIQTAVVNNAAENFTDSKAAYEVWATADGIGTSWGLGTNIYFDEAQDWSGTNTLNFDVLTKDNCPTRSYEICLISGEQEVLSNKLWPKAATSTWSTVSIARSSFTNVDWTNVKGIRIYMQFDADSGRYTGVEKSSFYVDNMYTSYTLVPDTDLLSHYNTSMVATGGTLSVVNGATEGNTASELSCEAHQLQLSGETATLDIPVSGKLSALNTLSIAAKLSKGTLSVQPYDADGALVGAAKTLTTSADAWNVHTFAATEFGYADKVEGYRFTVTGAEENAVLLLDDFVMTYQSFEEDTDLFATETVTYPGIDNVNSKAEMQPYTTKDSNAAIHIRKDVKENNGWPYVLVEFQKAKDMTDLLNISLDARFGKNTIDWIGVYLYDENGNVSTGNGYNSSKTYDWEQCIISGSDIDYGAADKTKIKKIKLQLNFDPGTNRPECQNQLFDIWLDNLQFVMKENDGLYVALDTGAGNECVVLPIAGPLHGKDEDTFHKFVGDSWSGTPRISINDAGFKSSLTAADSISFWTYIPTPASTSNIKSLSLGLYTSALAEIKGQMVIPFDTWTKVTLSGAELQNYLNQDGLVIWFRTEMKDTSIGGQLYPIAYFSDIEITKSKYSALDTGTGNTCVIQSVAGPLHEKEGEVFYKFIGDSWSGTPRISINDTDFKGDLTAADSISFWTYIPTPAATSNIKTLSFGLYSSELAEIKGQMEIPFDTWKKITLSGAELQSYLNKDGLVIWFRTEKKDTGVGGQLYPVAYFSDIEITKSKYSALDTGTGNTCVIQSVAGPLHEKEGEVFYKFIGDSWSGTPRISINDTDFKGDLTATDSISFWTYIPTPATTSNIKSLSLGLYTGVLAEIKGQTLIPFDTWTKVTLSGAELQNYLNNDGLVIWFRTEKKDTGVGGQLYPVAYFSDIEITKGTN